jgi:hypothetical protein
MDRLDDSKRNFILSIRNIVLRHTNIILFLFFFAGYFLWRYVGFNYLVWDDTSSVSYNIYVNNCHYSFSNKDFLLNAFKESFGTIQVDGYRPFARLWKIIGIAHFSTSRDRLVPFITVNAFIVGLLAVVYFHLSRHFLRTSLAALFAVFMLLFSTPVLTGLLIICTGVHVIVALFISFGLVCYFKMADTKSYKVLWFNGLILCMLIGPLFREFIGLLPLLIVILEVQRLWRFSWLMIVALIFFLHALFPTALIKWLIFPKIQILPVFAMGNLLEFLQRGTTIGGDLRAFASTLKNLHWRIFIDIISVYPPTVFALFLLSWWLTFRRSGKLIIDRNTKFILIFFLLSFLPFLKVFNEQVHLSYSLVPMSILLAACVKELWLRTAVLRHFRQIAKVILIFVIIVVMADHALNVYAVRKATQDIYKGIMKFANWFIDNTPKGSYVITNAHHLEDIRFYSNGHIEPWGAPGGIPDQRHWMYNASDLQILLNERGSLPVYFFDVRIKETTGQRGPERILFYVRDKNVEMADLGILHRTQSRYPFIDPLKYLIPIEEVAWPGPPDLEFDFYRGQALDSTPFLREVYAEYHLYKAINDKVVASGPPQLLEQDYDGFNLILFRNRVYAIPQSEGAFDLERVEKGGYSRSFQGDNIRKVKREIIEVGRRSKLTGEELFAKPPKLLEENYHGFNIIVFRNRVYAIPQPEGAFDLERVKKGEYSRSFQSSSLQEVKKAIDSEFFSSKVNDKKAAELPPQLLEENYRGFNLVVFRNRVYAIPQSEGAFDLERVEKGGYSRSFQGSSVQEVKKAIDEEFNFVTDFLLYCKQRLGMIFDKIRSRK